MKNKIHLASPHMGGHEMKYVQEAFDTNWIAPLGENVNRFEQELAEYIGVSDAAALSAGTAAIHMALKAVGCQKGDIVFCSSLTFSASANPILYENATPVFIDSEYASWNMDPDALERAFQKYPNPKAVIVVDLYGQSADWDRLLEICNRHHVPVIEDAAEALGSEYKGKKCGIFGDYGVFSFNGNKIITTSGGGMLVSNNDQGIQKVRFWSTQSREPERHYQHEEIGYNYRMSNIAAGIGRGQLKVLKERVTKKTEIFNLYQKAFAALPDIQMMPVCQYGKPNFWLSCLTLRKGAAVQPLDIILALEQEHVESRPIWKPMHLQPFFQSYDFFTRQESGSVSEDIFERGLCLPSDTKMLPEEQERVIQIIRGLF